MNLAGSAVDFAREHIERYYDSDFFPKLDEFEAVWANWDEVRAFLTTRPINEVRPLLLHTFPSPKSPRGYRIVHQLDPLGAIVFTALARSVAAEVEASRVPVLANQMFSYRISISGPNFFASGNGYQAFVEHCMSLSEQFEYVFVADIADFYNSIYIHRIRNALENSHVAPPGLARVTEDFLLRLNSSISQGIPVGPAASIVLSEAILSDIDQFISNQGFIHARYVDDIRVFAASREELAAFEERFCEFLYSAHRLQCATHKTAILSTAEFAANYLDNVERRERTHVLEVARVVCDYGSRFTEADINDLVEKYLTPSVAPAPEPEIDEVWARILRQFQQAEEEERRAIQEAALRQLLGDAMAGPTINIGLARHALRRAEKLRVQALMAFVLENYARFAPVLPDVFLYLAAVTTPEAARQQMHLIRSLCGAELTKRSRLARHWLHWYLSSFGELAMDPQCSAELRNNASVVFQARAARTTRNLAWVRSMRDRLSTLGVPERRALMMASVVMASDERRAVLRPYVNSTDIIDRSIAKWALAQ